MLVLFMVLSVIIAYFLFRWSYILDGDEAKYNPHGMAIVIMLVPLANVIFVLFLLLGHLFRKIKTHIKIPKFNYKKFFLLKEK